MSSGNDRRARIVAALAVRNGADLTIAGVCDACAATLLVGATIAVIVEGDLPAGIFVSDVRYESLEDLQFTVGSGPGLLAHRVGRPVVETDLALRPPAEWAEVARAAVAAGLRSVSAFPLHIGAARLGALTLYQELPGPLGDDRYADALVMADVVTALLLAAQAGATSTAELAAELVDGAVDTAEVHQASGMVSVQLAVGVGDALVALRARAFAEGRPVRAVAVDVVARRLRFDL